MSYCFFIFLVFASLTFGVCVSMEGYLLLLYLFIIYLSIYRLDLLFHRVIGSLIFKITLLPVCHVLLFPFVQCILFLFSLNVRSLIFWCPMVYWIYTYYFRLLLSNLYLILFWKNVLVRFWDGILWWNICAGPGVFFTPHVITVKAGEVSA